MSKLLILVGIAALIIAVGNVVINYADNWDEIVKNSYEMNGFIHDLID